MSCSKDITVFFSVNKQMTLKWKYKYNLLEQVHMHNYLHKNELKLYNTSLITLSKFLIRVGVIKIVIVINCNLITFFKIIENNCNSVFTLITIIEM